MKRALIVGIDSTIGNALQKKLLDAGWEVFGTSRRINSLQQHVFYLDLSKESEFCFDVAVDVVFLCASITKIVSCEEAPEYCFKINLDAPVRLAKYFLKKNSHVVFLSTNAVFDGKKPAYKVNDTTCPITTYGESKERAEKKLLQLSSENISIVRLTKVLMPNFPLFTQWIDLLKAGSIIEPFYDLYISPLSLEIVTTCLKDIALKKIPGIVHISGESDVSYQSIAEYLNFLMELNASSLIKPKSVAFGRMHMKAAPLYTSLDMVESRKLLHIPDTSIFAILNKLFNSDSDVL